MTALRKGFIARKIRIKALTQETIPGSMVCASPKKA
jgi:hypothetical protein